jgi:hypothetical protein
LEIELDLVLETTVPPESRWLYRRRKEFPAGKPFPLFWEKHGVRRRYGSITVPGSIFV